MYIRLMLSSKCNNDCSYCFVTGNPNYDEKLFELNHEAVENRLLELKDRNLLDGIELVGGEPFYNLELIKWLLDLNSSKLGNVRINIFTSATINIDEAISLMISYTEQMQINVVISYDGSLSNRNKGNYSKIQEAIWKMKRAGISGGIRWSINKEDIPNLLQHFKEISDLRVQYIMFFPMKYADYTTEEITEFNSQFLEVLRYAQENQVAFLNITGNTTKLVVNQKANFSCNDNLTVLPNGKLCNCYVSYFSSGQSGSLLYDDLDIAIENSEIEQITLPERCKDCNLMFDCCNKCYGNLLEYQRLTGNEFFSTYCDLINSLSKTYIRFLLTEVDTNASIVITQKDKILSFQNINGAIWRLEPAERL